MAERRPLVTMTLAEARRAARLTPELRGRIEALTDAEIGRQIDADPDVAPDLGDPTVRARLGLELDVTAIRKGLGLTQRQFVELFDIGLGTLRDWEQGRRAPTGLALALLRMLAVEPRATLDLWSRVAPRRRAGNEARVW